ncbi:TetR/AcrR family transcriptional regulator [Bhargavaea cecembensis]|uniref:TetR/AcrR family transcriptional regulator n=1 Tax=Bhargavaea cecembensis TaxID=394098 RepID=UPI000694DB67|nr:TetR/AcrR family transcriptional regulator [Bhargavaea cecembensis]
MNDPKTKIIEAAATLLTERGFHGTSVQDIAGQAGISKGAFYLHFKSKDALYIEIFRHYYTEFRAEVEEAYDPARSPADNYRRQLEIQIDQFLRNTDFIVMYIREQALSMNEELFSFIRGMHADMVRWYSGRLTDMYGEAIAPFIVDIATIVEGVKSSYMQLFITNPEKLDPRALTGLLIRITGLAADSFLGGSQAPLLDENTIQGLFTELFPAEDGRTDGIRTELEEMRALTGVIPLSGPAAAYLASTIDFIETMAAEGDAADKTAIQGALAAFKPYPEFRRPCSRLAELLGVPLL